VAVSSRQAHLDLLARPSLLPLWSIIKVTPRFATPPMRALGPRPAVGQRLAAGCGRLLGPAGQGRQPIRAAAQSAALLASVAFGCFSAPDNRLAGRRSSKTFASRRVRKKAVSQTAQNLKRTIARSHLNSNIGLRREASSSYGAREAEETCLLCSAFLSAADGDPVAVG
jgi:hypothetical protein